jgi:hypothetical protein
VSNLPLLNPKTSGKYIGFARFISTKTRPVLDWFHDSSIPPISWF